MQARGHEEAANRRGGPFVSGPHSFPGGLEALRGLARLCSPCLTLPCSRFAVC